MLLFILAYIGGLLSIFSPCVLPVLPFVFARSDQPFRKSGLPILIGMAATFTLLASIATVGGALLVRINQFGRYAALLLLLLLGVALISTKLSDLLMRPFVSFGGRLQQRAAGQGTLGGALLIGVAVGFLWAPCGGPILGLVLTGAALNGLNLQSAMLLFTFAAGAATSLAGAIGAGGKVFTLMKRGLGAEVWIRRSLGVAVIAGAVIIAFGWDTRFLAQLPFFSTTGTEQQLIRRLGSPPPQPPAATGVSTMPPIDGATLWLNSPPLRSDSLRGKVVIVDFWTYSCINCLRTLPFIEAWDKKYRGQGLVIIGVHAPEFAFEKDPENVRRAVRDLGIAYPVALDNRYAIWNAYGNQVWPAHYLFDAEGRLRERHFGEGGYEETERTIRKLLAESHNVAPVTGGELVKVSGHGALAAPSYIGTSPETYIGYDRMENFISREPVGKDRPMRYTPPAAFATDEWALSGWWQVTPENAVSQKPGGAIIYRFQGRDLHLVLGSTNHNAVRFRITLDGHAPGPDHGADIDAQGNGVIREQRLYQLIRQHGEIRVRTFRIEFQDAGAEAFAFTFG